jgi:hypothetical protein
MLELGKSTALSSTVEIVPTLAGSRIFHHRVAEGTESGKERVFGS